MKGLISKIRAAYAVFRGNGNSLGCGDEFTTHLQGVNGGFLEPGNLWCFDHVVKNLPSDSPMVEIGSFAGLSTNLIHYYRERHGRTNPLFNCDRWEPHASGPISDSSITFEEMFRFVESTYRRNIEEFSHDDLPHT